jgi:hypothetical protein
MFQVWIYTRNEDIIGSHQLGNVLIYFKDTMWYLFTFFCCKFLTNACQRIHDLNNELKSTIPILIFHWYQKPVAIVYLTRSQNKVEKFMFLFRLKLDNIDIFFIWRLMCVTSHVKNITQKDLMEPECFR